MTQPDDPQPAAQLPPGWGQQQPQQPPQPQAPQQPAQQQPAQEPPAQQQPAQQPPVQPPAVEEPTQQQAAPHQPHQPPSPEGPTQHQPAQPPSPEGPTQHQPAQPPSPEGPTQQQPAVPLPPGWGQQQPEQPHQPQQSPWAHPGYPTPQDPFHTTTMTPTSAQIPPFGATPPPPPKKRNLGLIITAVALGVMLVLCAVGGVGAFLLLRNSEGPGADSARDAAADFLTAVYKEGDAKEAEQLVCREARDTKAIEAKINEIKDQKAKYKSPSITWDAPRIENESAEKADTTVTVRLTTSDEKVSEQTLKLSLVKREGWFVCEVEEQKK